MSDAPLDLQAAMEPDFYTLILAYCPGCGKLRVVHRGLAFCECEDCARMRDRLAGEARLKELIRKERLAKRRAKKVESS